MKKLFSLVLTLLVVLSLNVAAMAAETTPTVIFDGDAQEFTYENVADTDGANPDLFPVLKGMIPGDVEVQNIKFVANNVSKDDTVKVYLQSQNENDDYKALLESVVYTVDIDGEDVTGDLADKIYLGEFPSNEVANIAVKLDIPLSTGNEIQSLTAMVDWVFTAEIIADGNNPDTGDESNIWLPITIILVAVVLMVGLIVFRKSRKDK